MTQRLDREKSDLLRAEARSQRLVKGVPYDEFEAGWLKKKPPEEILNIYGTWPTAEPLGPVLRP